MFERKVLSWVINEAYRRERKEARGEASRPEEALRATTAVYPELSEDAGWPLVGLFQIRRARCCSHMPCAGGKTSPEGVQPPAGLP